MKNNKKKIFVCLLIGILSIGIKIFDDKIINVTQKEFEYIFTKGNFYFDLKATDFKPDEEKLCFVLDDKTARQGLVLVSYKHLYNQGIYINKDGIESLGFYSGRYVTENSTLIIQFMGYTDKGTVDVNFHCVGADKSVKLDEIPKMYYIPFEITTQKPIGDFVISMADVDGAVNINTLVAVNYDKQYKKSELVIGEYLYEQ